MNVRRRELLLFLFIYIPATSGAIAGMVVPLIDKDEPSLLWRVGTLLLGLLGFFVMLLIGGEYFARRRRE